MKYLWGFLIYLSLVSAYNCTKKNKTECLDLSSDCKCMWCATVNGCYPTVDLDVLQCNDGWEISFRCSLNNGLIYIISLIVICVCTYVMICIMTGCCCRMISRFRVNYQSFV